jgi:hypothetical protein
MASDVPVELVTHAAASTQPSRRLPIGVGLTIGACASVALWTFIAVGLRALFT